MSAIRSAADLAQDLAPTKLKRTFLAKEFRRVRFEQL